MEIVVAVAKWSFVVAGILVALTAAFFSAVVGIAAIHAAAEILIRKIERRRTLPLVRSPVFPRPLIRPIPRNR